MVEVTAIPEIELHDGVRIPQLGFGVFQVPPDDTRAAVEDALEAGYRHIDTAAAYRNERGVGEAIAASGIARDEVFVTTKLWNTQQGYDSALAGFESSLGRLGLDHVDLYLIHWPMPTEDLFVETWRAFERIHEEGGSRTIGVSNFRVEDLERLEAETSTRPTVNQIELHPWLQQDELRRWDAKHDIATEAWSPLAKSRHLDDETINSIASAHGKSPAQTILRWHIQLGNVVFPKSVTPERIRENIDIFDFELSAEEMERIEGLDSGERTGPDPAEFVAP
ncbi:MAG TPA: aldo/keto reductase [Solirubrobacterales bacterium]